VGIRFTWNAAKAAANRRKHGIAFEEALTVFGDPLARIHDDPEHSEGERREIIIGRSTKGRLILVSFYGAPWINPRDQRAAGVTA
jgi:uncharacterized DUF497 family protein